MAKADYSSFNLKDYPIQDVKALHVVVLRTLWNDEIVSKMQVSCIKALKSYGVSADHIHEHSVPGSYELPMGAKMVLTSAIKADAIICLGCVIQGETKHDDYINHTIARSINNLGIVSGIPIIFGVLTTNNTEQAFSRAGGERGDKGAESASAALVMVSLKEQLATKAKKISF